MHTVETNNIYVEGWVLKGDSELSVEIIFAGPVPLPRLKAVYIDGQWRIREQCPMCHGKGAVTTKDLLRPVRDSLADKITETIRPEEVT